MNGSRNVRVLILILCAVAGLALLIASIGAALALLTGHARWIELAWLSIAASLLALAVDRLWPIELVRKLEN
jgi:hypothetical protein